MILYIYVTFYYAKFRKKDNGSASVTFLSTDPRSLRPEEWLNMESHRTPVQIKEMATVPPL